MAKPTRTFILPQSNFTCEGSLCDNICYPRAAPANAELDAQHDSRLTDLLTAVGLEYLVERWGLHSVR